MDEDLDDGPPLLVSVDEEAPDLVDHLSLVKVPITIVTGAYLYTLSTLIDTSLLLYFASFRLIRLRH